MTFAIVIFAKNESKSMSHLEEDVTHIGLSLPILEEKFSSIAEAMATAISKRLDQLIPIIRLERPSTTVCALHRIETRSLQPAFSTIRAAEDALNPQKSRRKPVGRGGRMDSN